MQKNPSITLSKTKIKKLLFKKNITKLKDFEIHYALSMHNTMGVKGDTPRQIWNGSRITTEEAEAVAIYFGLAGHSSLLTEKDNTTILSTVKVKNLLAEKGLFTLNAFEIHYAQVMGNKNGSHDGTPRKVWFGKKIAFTKAGNMAAYFGLENYLSLLADSSSPWEALVSSPSYQQSFMTFHAKDPGQLGLVLFEYSDNNDHESLDKYNIGVQCHLTLSGDQGDHYFIAIRSYDEFEVLAPITQEYCSNRQIGTTLRYPQGEACFTFDSRKGGGFRELIAVKIPSPIPFNARSGKVGGSISIMELNSFANGLILDKSLKGRVFVSTYPFHLVHNC